MLIPLVPLIGVAAFSLVVPITIAIIVVLLFVTLSYLEVVKVYTKAGGAYVVARENFGLNVAQVAAVSLLIDYTLTVAVSVAAGVAALTSVFPSLDPVHDLDRHRPGRSSSPTGTCGASARPAGSSPSPPTSSSPTWCSLIVVGARQGGTRVTCTPIAHPPGTRARSPSGTPGSGLLYGATVFVVLKAFASGGSALTGTEAISNGVSIFRKPESRNARHDPGRSWPRSSDPWSSGCRVLASITHPVPYVVGHADGDLPGRQVRLRHQRARAVLLLRHAPGRRPCSSSSWRPTPASPASPSWPASWPRTPTCPAS